MCVTRGNGGRAVTGRCRRGVRMPRPAPARNAGRSSSGCISPVDPGPWLLDAADASPATTPPRPSGSPRPDRRPAGCRGRGGRRPEPRLGLFTEMNQRIRRAEANPEPPAAFLDRAGRTRHPRHRSSSPPNPPNGGGAVRSGTLPETSPSGPPEEEPLIFFRADGLVLRARTASPDPGGRAQAGRLHDLDVKGQDGGAGRDRTDDLSSAIAALSQLSYGPTRVPVGNTAPSRERPGPARERG